MLIKSGMTLQCSQIPVQKNIPNLTQELVPELNSPSLSTQEVLSKENVGFPSPEEATEEEETSISESPVAKPPEDNPEVTHNESLASLEEFHFQDLN